MPPHPASRLTIVATAMRTAVPRHKPNRARIADSPRSSPRECASRVAGLSRLSRRMTFSWLCPAGAQSATLPRAAPRPQRCALRAPEPFMSAELDNLLRIVLWVALIAIFYLNYRAWQNDYSLAGQRRPTASASQPL